MYEKRNQAYTMHPDFFDPLHQYASLEMNPKDPEFVKVQYHHEEPSVTVNEDGSVTFYMYAPKAATVAVGGMGGFFSADKVYLTPDGKGGFRTTIQDFPYAMHYYMWYVDDVPICNPKAGVNYGCFHSINTFDMADDKDSTAQLFSSMLPFLLLIFLYSGCISVAPESIAGEKERGTIASLLITPVKRSHIALGKIAALSIIALLSGASSAIGTIASVPKLMSASTNKISGASYGVNDYIMLGIIILSTALVLVTLIALISAFAKTIKEAQTYVTPLMIVVMLIGITSMFGSGARSQIYYYLIPIYNSVQSMVGIFSFHVHGSLILTTIASNLAVTAIGAACLAKMFDSEYIMFHK